MFPYLINKRWKEPNGNYAHMHGKNSGPAVVVDSPPALQLSHLS